MGIFLEILRKLDWHKYLFEISQVNFSVVFSCFSQVKKILGLSLFLKKISILFFQWILKVILRHVLGGGSFLPRQLKRFYKILKVLFSVYVSLSSLYGLRIITMLETISKIIFIYHTTRVWSIIQLWRYKKVEFH